MYVGTLCSCLGSEEPSRRCETPLKGGGLQVVTVGVSLWVWVVSQVVSAGNWTPSSGRSADALNYRALCNSRSHSCEAVLNLMSLCISNDNY
jgi:hypothetical protein